MNVIGWTVAAALLLAAAPQQGGDEPLTGRAVRFYSPASSTTTIEGVCEVRLAALLRGVGQVGRYRVDVSVLDSAGLELQRSDWSREVSAALAHARGATVVESFSFSAAPGRYRVRMRLTPTSGGDAVEREIAVEAFRTAPAMSDLLLANAVRQPASDSEPLGAGEVRRADLVMRTAPAPRLTPAEAQIAWYAELYPRAGGATTGQLKAEVLRSDGRSVVSTPPRSVEVAATGGLLRGSLDLAGLPEGAYRIRLTVRVGDSTLSAEAPFAMSSVATMAATQAAPPTAGGTSGGDLFEDADEMRLDSLFAPLVYVAEGSRDLGLYRTLSVDGKRRFLRDFWSHRDPSPGTPDNPARDEFYRGVAYATGAFRESGAADLPGWNTDRGRVYLKNGRPDEVLRKPSGSRPYEAWRFTRGRARWYVFMDETGFGHYVLVGTDDRRESSRQRWQVSLGPDGTRDVYQFLNLDLRELQDLGINP